MDDLKRFFEESPLASRISLPTNIVVRRLMLRPEAVGSIIESGTFAPSGGEVCELEVGGRLIARGRIVRRRGKFFFKVTETAKGDTV